MSSKIIFNFGQNEGSLQLKPLFFLLFAFLILIGLPAFADSSVKKISKKTGRLIIGESYPKGTKLCVFDENDTKILCGKVIKSKESGSILALRRGAKFNKIKVGFTVKGDDGDSSSSEASSMSNNENFMLHFSLSPQFLSPISYNLAIYKNPDNGVPPDTLWSNYATQSHSFEGKDLHSFSLVRTLSFGFDYLFTPTFGAGLKIRLKLPTSPSPLVATNYSPLEEKNNEYVETSTSHRGSGFFISGLYKMVFSPSSMMYFSGGIDYESASLTLKAERKDDNDPNMKLALFNAKAAISVLSLRSDMIYTYYLGSFGIDLGLGLLIPITEMGKGFSGTYLDTDENTTQLTSDPLKDLERGIDLKKNSFGVETFLGTRFKF